MECEAKPYRCPDKEHHGHRVSENAKALMWHL